MFIAVVAGDAGGAAAVAPVIAALDAGGLLKPKPLAYRQACNLWARRGLSFETLDEDLLPDAADDLLRSPPVSLLLTGTSANPAMLESRFIEAARRLAIPSVALLDSWVNYRARFAVGGSGRMCLPDRIAVMDESARTEMVAVGFDPSILVVTGQPAFDDLSRWRDLFTSDRKREVRAALGVADRSRLVLFASQPFSALYGDPTHLQYPGFDEHDVLRQLVSALERIAIRSTSSIVLLVRPHPREDARNLAAIASDTIRVVVSDEGDGRDAVLAADLVTGMNSMLLMDACYMQCVTVSLQPGFRHGDVLPTNRLGLSHAVYDAREIEAAIERFLLDDVTRSAMRTRLRTFQPRGDATGRVVGLLHTMLGASEQG